MRLDALREKQLAVLMLPPITRRRPPAEHGLVLPSSTRAARGYDEARGVVGAYSFQAQPAFLEVFFYTSEDADGERPRMR